MTVTNHHQREAALRKFRAYFRLPEPPRGGTDGYADVTQHTPGDIVNAAVMAMVESWTGEQRPWPAQLLEACAYEQRKRASEARREQHARITGAVTPCPECDREGLTWDDVQRADAAVGREYKPGHPQEVGPSQTGWAEDRKTGQVFCRAHRITWPGRLPDHDPGDLEPHDVAALAASVAGRMKAAGGPQPKRPVNVGIVGRPSRGMLKA